MNILANFLQQPVQKPRAQKQKRRRAIELKSQREIEIMR
jgi:hypothetical protein